jgi:hypothetical protein
MSESPNDSTREYVRASAALVGIPVADDAIASVERSFAVLWERHLQLEAEMEGGAS